MPWLSKATKQFLITGLLQLTLACSAVASTVLNDPPLNVYLSADMTHTSAVGESLRLGLQAGLIEGAGRYGGPAPQVIVRDHKNNMRRTERTFDEAYHDPHTLAVVGGMHSPHYLRHGPKMNERKMVLMLPWSAGGTLTRLADGPENHIFRVSLDDSKAAPFLAAQAQMHGCTRVAAIALDNGWGRSNVTSLAQHLPSHGMELVHQGFIRRDAGTDTVGAEVAKMHDVRPDCVVMVLAARGSAYTANALLEWENPPNVLSHWGLLGGGFHNFVSQGVWDRLDIAILSTCVLETPVDRPEQLAIALRATETVQAGVQELGDFPSPTAFAHAYDLALILSAAAAQATTDPRWAEGQTTRNAALRDALQSLNAPVVGLLKTYDPPFQAVSADTQNGHEALRQTDLCLARKRPDGGVEAYSRVSTQ
ncbi:MAG: ABC transporter substrate-binding protein [Pseudomonadota bacterium]